jgi:hypothetical protein
VTVAALGLVDVAVGRWWRSRPSSKGWLAGQVRPLVEQVAAQLAGVGAGGRARRRHQQRAWGIVLGLVVFGLVVLVCLFALGFLVGAVLVSSVAVVR